MNKNIDVNILIGYDNVKVVCTFKNDNDNTINIHEESFSSNANADKNQLKIFIKESIQNIEEKICKKITKVNLIFDDFMKNFEHLGVSTKIIEDIIEFNNKFLNIDDFNKIIQEITKKSQNVENDKVLLSIIPFKYFYVEDFDAFEKESSQFPINKKINKIRVIFSVRYMNKSNYKKIVELLDMIDVNVERTLLESQIAIYENSNVLSKNNNETHFTLSIENNKTMLITSVNNIAIKTDILDYSYSNLIQKIANNCSISYFESKNIIDCYGNLNSNDNNIVYFSQLINGKVHKQIKIKNISEIIKSFLKSICKQANGIIKSRIKNFDSLLNTELKLIGKLSKINNIEVYCSKYFEKIEIISEKKENSIYKWNRLLTNSKNYWKYVNILNSNLKLEGFYYNNNYNKQNNYKKYQLNSEISLANSI